MDPGRRRPRAHFTPRAGWLNDPHGVVHADGRYHLYFQHNPAGTQWDEATVWGHATSTDLVVWAEQPVALTPGPGEVGCWTGAVVSGPDGPALFYTRVATGGAVSVARAAGDLHTWRRDPPGAVVGEAPPGVLEMRDPMVWAAPGGWRMVLGARLDGEVPGLLQYSSADGRSWVHDGVIVRGANRTGSMWECPQLFELDGTWVLIVSVVDGGVEYALGDYDGQEFTARSWGEFGRGPMYATTTFLDADGRRCAISWLRERDGSAPAGSPWSGALSLPWVLSVRGDRLIAAPHPHLDRYLTGDGDGLRAEGGLLFDGDEALVAVPPGGEITVIADADLVEVVVEGVSGLTTARRRQPGESGVRILRFAAPPAGNADGHA